MIQRQFGSSGITVSALGLGAGQIGADSLAESDVEQMLNQALDLGVTLIDTARGYGLSEERIRRYLSHRRAEFILSTKVGYDVPGQDDWTYGAVLHGVDQALRRLQTDVIDIVHLHSCPLETLQQGDVIKALEDVQKAGKIRVAAYSGENEALDYAIQTKRFQSVQASLNFCDQRVINSGLAQARDQNLGFIAKRPVANAPWRYNERPVGRYVEEYWLRWKTMQPDPHGLPWNEVALRFSAFTPGVSSCIVGTASLEHLKENIAIVEHGPLPAAIYSDLLISFESHDDGWIGQI